MLSLEERKEDRIARKAEEAARTQAGSNFNAENQVSNEEILKGSATKVQAAIEGFSTERLEQLLALENEGKGRANVIEVINEAGKLASETAASWK